MMQYDVIGLCLTPYWQKNFLTGVEGYVTLGPIIFPTDLDMWSKSSDG